MDRQVPTRLLWGCRCILLAASLIVPRRQRAEWFREWYGEVWHWVHFLVESERLSPQAELELARHCWGAFPDALWQRFNREVVVGFVRDYPLTPRFCLVGLATALSLLVVESVPSPSGWTSGSRLDAASSDLLTVSPSSRSHWLQPEILRDASATWARSNPLIVQAATYAWRPSVVRGPAGKEEVLSARVTAGLFGLLGAAPILGRLFDPSDPSHCANCVVLSYAIWHTQFHESREIIGENLKLNGAQLQIIGVLPAQFRLPGMDIALFQLFGADSHPRMPGLEWPAALLRIRPGARTGSTKRELKEFVNQTSNLPAKAVLEVLSPEDIRFQWLESCGVIAGMAIVLLIIMNWRTAVRLFATGPGAAREIFRWWLFLAAKSSLLMMIALAVSLKVAQTLELRFSLGDRMYADPIALWVFAVGLTLALSWSVRDQLARCRRCLKRLRMQVDLGTSVGTLCQPSGVELICDAGHGVLHVPTLPLSCLDSERWTDLDESWQEISGPHLTAAL